MIDHTYRRIMGVLLGAWLGLTYGLVSQTINRIAMPGIPVYQPPFGPGYNTALCLVVGLLLGLVSSWPVDSIWGTVLGSSASALAVVAVALLTADLNLEHGPGAVVAIAFLGVPIFGMLVPMTAILRWAANQQEQARADAAPMWKRLALPVALTAVVGAAGATLLYPHEARTVILRMNALIQAGLQAADASTLPGALQPDDVVGFIERAKGPYTLEWKRTDLNRYAIPIPVTRLYRQESGVIARFESGWVLVCIFVPDNDEPECKGF